MRHIWVKSTPKCPVPTDAVIGGYDSDRSPIYIGRFFHEGVELLANVVPEKHKAYAVWEGSEIIKTEGFEILVGENYRWYECFIGIMPRTAVQMGAKSRQEPLYIGRGHLNGSLKVGQFNLSDKSMAIPLDGEGCAIDCCQILTYHYPHRWVSASLRDIPKDAVVGGYETNKKKIFVGRAHHNGEVLPAKISPKTGGAYVSVAGEDVFTSKFEFLTGDGYSWVPGKHYRDMPLGAVSSGRTRNKELVYVGRGYYNGSLTPGKIYPTEYCVYIPYAGKEVRVSDYEVLVRNK